ncbi:transposase family protein [Streptomyces johnsoniae]|uniref:Transposase family protein n=1 Tax=Streptomyces johnsoniae TaxID=3075532 RepID=A0ABU2S392_9ACTN|nr:transposase family protein [Streptomyces sp. DSM 41886]MDT0443447.1 transposase family protein [Streptomyces sp. DSM 41886]
MRWPVPAAASSPIPSVLVKLGPLDIGEVADLQTFLNLVPDPRARRGRWYSLTAILLVCACAAVSGARSVDEIAEWAARASDTVLTAVGVRRHPLRWRRAPSRTTIGRVLRPSTVTPWTPSRRPRHRGARSPTTLFGNDRTLLTTPTRGPSSRRRHRPRRDDAGHSPTQTINSR